MVQEPGQPEPNRHARLVDWAQSLVARATRARSVLSPWVQRALETGAAGRLRPLSLSGQDGRGLVERVTRQGEGSRVWRPDLGRVSPAALDRFGGEIVRRHQPLADKYRVEIPEWDQEQATSLVLAPGGSAGPAVMPDARQPGPPSGLPPMPAVPPSAPPVLQWHGVPPQAASQERPAVRRQPGERVFSRVEEITPTVTRRAEPGSPQQPDTEGGTPDDDRHMEGLAPGEQLAAEPSERAAEPPLATEGEVPPLQRAAGEQEAVAKKPAPPPGEAPLPEAEGTPGTDIDAGEPSQATVISAAPRERRPPPVSPPHVETEGEAVLQRQAGEERPPPVSPPQAKAEGEAVLARQAEGERPSPVSRPQVEAEGEAVLQRQAGEERPPPVSPPQVKAEGEAVLQRQAEEERPAPVSPSQVGAGGEAVLESQAEGGRPPPVSPPQVRAEGEVSPQQRRPGRPPPLQRQAEEERPSPVSPAEVGAAETEPISPREDGELPIAPSLPGAEAAGVEPAVRGEVPPLDAGGGEERPTGPSLPEVQATDVGPARRGEVPPLQRALLKDRPLHMEERTETVRPEPAHKPEGEAPAPAPEKGLPPEQISEGEGARAMPSELGLPPVQRKSGSERDAPVRQLPALRPPSAGPRQPAERVEAGREPVSMPDEGPAPDSALPILRKAPRTRLIEDGPVQRTAILPQARMGAGFEEEPARPARSAWPDRGRPSYYAPVTASQATEEPQPRGRGLPMAVVRQPVPEFGFRPEAPVQRLPLAIVPPLETAPPSGGHVQRQNGSGPAVSAAPAGEDEPNLDELARQVYPLVKRMLAVERERRLSR